MIHGPSACVPFPPTANTETFCDKPFPPTYRAGGVACARCDIADAFRPAELSGDDAWRGDAAHVSGWPHRHRHHGVRSDDTSIHLCRGFPARPRGGDSRRHARHHLGRARGTPPWVACRGRQRHVLPEHAGIGACRFQHVDDRERRKNVPHGCGLLPWWRDGRPEDRGRCRIRRDAG